MTSLRVSVVAALLTACVSPAPELRPYERAMVHAAMQAWDEAGLPPPIHCDMAATVVRVGACSVPTTAGCVAFERIRPMQARPKRVAITVRPEKVDDDKLLAHEMMHALYWCSGADGAFDDRNRDHLDSRVWQDVGGDSSVQARTRALASQP